MHAVVVRVTIQDFDTAVEFLTSQVVPGISQAPGFVTGHWTRKGDSGLSMIIFESEDAAQSASERIPSMATEGVTLEGVEVREVVAHA